MKGPTKKSGRDRGSRTRYIETLPQFTACNNTSHSTLLTLALEANPPTPRVLTSDQIGSNILFGRKRLGHGPCSAAQCPRISNLRWLYYNRVSARLHACRIVLRHRHGCMWTLRARFSINGAQIGTNLSDTLHYLHTTNENKKWGLI